MTGRTASMITPPMAPNSTVRRIMSAAARSACASRFSPMSCPSSMLPPLATLNASMVPKLCARWAKELAATMSLPRK